MRSFTPALRGELIELMKWRRDGRRFKPDTVDPAVLATSLRAFALTPELEPKGWEVRNPSLSTLIERVSP